MMQTINEVATRFGAQILSRGFKVSGDPGSGRFQINYNLTESFAGQNTVFTGLSGVATKFDEESGKLIVLVSNAESNKNPGMFPVYYSLIAREVVRQLDKARDGRPISWYFYGCNEEVPGGWVDVVKPHLVETADWQNTYHQSEIWLNNPSTPLKHGLPSDLDLVFEQIFKYEEH